MFCKYIHVFVKFLTLHINQEKNSELKYNFMQYK